MSDLKANTKTRFCEKSRRRHFSAFDNTPQRAQFDTQQNEKPLQELEAALRIVKETATTEEQIAEFTEQQKTIERMREEIRAKASAKRETF